MLHRSLEPIVYRIDENDLIYWLSPNWLDFATLNFAGDSCHPKNIIGKPLNTFIKCEKTIYLYDLILNHVRNNNKTVSFPFRCDAPELRRGLSFKIIPLANNHVEFRSTLEWTEFRPQVTLLHHSDCRIDDVLSICSICKKVEVEESWEEVEVAMNHFKLGEAKKLPSLSHGYCPECFDTVMNSINHSMAA